MEQPAQEQRHKASPLLLPLLSNRAWGDLPRRLRLAGQPEDIIHNWMPGIPLSQAIKQTLTTAFPNTPLQINISPNLVINHQDAGFYDSIEQYAQFIKGLSHNILGDISATGYRGIHIAATPSGLKIFDYTTKAGANAKKINYIELIGQPTWINLKSDPGDGCLARRYLDGRPDHAAAVARDH